MLHISDRNLFGKIVADAVAKAHLTCADAELRDRWINAIAKAAATLEGDLSFVHWNPKEETLRFWSPKSNEIYQTNGTCQCPAFENGKPCYHRAMKKLVQNYFLAQKNPSTLIDFADAIFFDRHMSAKEKVEWLNKSIAEGRVELKIRVKALAKFVN